VPLQTVQTLCQIASVLGKSVMSDKVSLALRCHSAGKGQHGFTEWDSCADVLAGRPAVPLCCFCSQCVTSHAAAPTLPGRALPLLRETPPHRAALPCLRSPRISGSAVSSLANSLRRPRRPSGRSRLRSAHPAPRYPHRRH
jgi:hypothetical protein